MATGRILLVRETPSLADAVQLLLETVGYTVVPVNSLPVRRRRTAAPIAPVEAVIFACNEPTSSMLERLPDALPAGSRGVPTVVLGRPARELQGTTHPGVRFVGLPLDATSFLALIGSLVEPGGTVAGSVTVPPTTSV